MRKSEERQKLLAQEVDHRAKNLLAVTQSILHQTSAKDIESYKETLSGRIMALARCHSLIADSRWRGADLAQIVEDELSPYRSNEDDDLHERIQISGPLAVLQPAAAQSLAMAIHELTTNAVKYGALSSPRARLSVCWRLSEDELSLTWSEMGGPPVENPPPCGNFGTRVITTTIENQLGGSATFDWRREGLVMTLSVPSEHFSHDGAAFQRNKKISFVERDSDLPGKRLSGQRILVVEDEALIAGQIEYLLASHGCSVVGPANNVERALARAISEPLDAATVDVNLAGVRSDAVASALHERGIPFVVLSGYSSSGITGALGRAPVLSKPFDEAALVKLLAAEISNRSNADSSPNR
jgi:two-component sensor histidine kinase/CheY-like chemotaxis protein